MYSAYKPLEQSKWRTNSFQAYKKQAMTWRDTQKQYATAMMPALTKQQMQPGMLNIQNVNGLLTRMLYINRATKERAQVPTSDLHGHPGQL